MTADEEATTTDLPEAPVTSPALAGPSVATLAPATWKWWEVFAVLALSLAIGIVLSGGMLALTGESGAGLMVASIALDLTVLGSFVVWLQTAHPDWVKILGWPERVLTEVWAGLVRGMVLYLLAAFVAYGLSELFGAIAGQPSRPPQQLDEGLAGFGLVAAAIFAMLIAPVTEEMVFRAGFFRAFRAKRGFFVSALLSGVMFGAIHYAAGPWQNSFLLVGTMVFVGFGFAFIYERRGTILAPIVAHVTFNVVGFVLIMSGR